MIQLKFYDPDKRDGKHLALVRLHVLISFFIFERRCDGVVLLFLKTLLFLS